MAKKGSKNQGSSSSAAPVLPPAANAKKSKKDSKKDATAGSSSLAATKAAATEAAAALAPPKPTAKQIIGGASWTGKLPVNLFNEYCQKQKWEKPVYEIRKTPDGYLGWVTLSAKDTKTQEITTLDSFKMPLAHKHLILRETALEARHCAATYALFRTCSMQNRHSVLPPDHKSLWKEFVAIKTADVKEGKAWMYEADPFKSQRERDAAKASAEKKRKEIEAAKAKEQKSSAVPGLVLRGKNLEVEDQKALAMRGWKNAPRIEMGKKSRTSIEALLRQGSTWNPYGIKLPKTAAASIVKELSRIGFRPSHVEEATEHCKDREECLEWLLLHVPEDDLPSWALPEKYMAGIAVAETNLKKEAAIKRLSLPGYAQDLCLKAYDENNGDESAAAASLQNMLVGFPPVDAGTGIELDMNQTPQGLWQDEVASIESVYADQFKRISDSAIQIKLQSVVNGQAQIDAYLQLQRAPDYPNKLLLGVIANLPSYIRLSILKQSLDYIEQEIKGEEMKMYFVIDWVQEHVNSLIEKPGRLLEISAVASAASETKPVLSDSANYNKRHKAKPTFISWREDPHSRNQWLERVRSKQWVAMEAKRQELPAWKIQDQLVRTVEDYDVTIISGETGSGKSTQSMQFILDNLYSRGLGIHANMLVTQPRRISALGLADRVAEERCTRVGDEVGYAIRGETKRGKDTRITFMTTGVLLRRLQVAGGDIQDVISSLANVSHIVVDEVHERSLDTDFLLTILRSVLTARRGLLKLVLMSATLDARSFSDYFERENLRVGLVNIEGRTYPVTDIYLDEILHMTGFLETYDQGDDSENSNLVGKAIQKLGPRINYDLIIEAILAIDRQLGDGNRGGILVFLPGVVEISRVCNELARFPSFFALPLHASLETKEQKRVFQRPPPKKRKVVIATNIAETSITIDDIVAVLDSGKVKEISYDPVNNMRRLEENWASKAACKQRRGRAGRVQQGTCYKLYTRKLEAESMADRPDPEICRVPLEQLCLSVRAMGIRSVSSFLAQAPTPPSTTAIEGALSLLQQMGAMDGDELTALGTQLSIIPADLRCAKLMVYGSIFGCLDDCIAIAAILSTRSPFVAPQAKRDEARAARMAFSRGDGDLLTDLAAFRAWQERLSQGYGQRQTRAFCDENFLSYNTLNDIDNTCSQYRDALVETGLLARNSSGDRHNIASTASPSLLRALTASAFSPQLARVQLPSKKFASIASGAVEVDPEARLIKYFTKDQGRVFVHPSSALFDSQSFSGRAAFVSYFTMISTSKVFIRDLTPFNAYTLLLFAGTLALDTLGRGLIVNDWLYLQGWARIGVLVARLRSLIDSVVARKIENPREDVSASKIIQTVVHLIELDGLDA
ncbi:putative ATP-dependent RNA helicase ucp12 [Ceratocystis fimbriata CBS 114723]|uniref:Putative ATP-dependent RNA helicase ucp12 n=1 Tax=Ceratocystis fimbriata CBS 114723 TaxID=1035309 RepID=A0A2C5X3E5_9PEZI|nr:putative ATP-dependent RNA helicase ucp12 [Ceratocystis fimbriata CBS 114723]